MTTDTELRDLLAAAAGGPAQGPAGWDDVTRRGRHRQQVRRLQSVAVFVIVAGLAITAIVLSTDGATVDTGPPVTQPAPTIPEDIDGSTVLQGRISGALAQGTSLRLFSGSAHSDINLCGLRVLVRESADQITVGLVDPQDERGVPWADCGDGAVGGLPAWDVWGAIELSTPAGDRTLVDLSSGETVPITDRSDLLFPTTLPAPFDVEDFREANQGVLGGPEDWYFEFTAEAPQFLHLFSSARVESDEGRCDGGQVVEVRSMEGCFVQAGLPSLSWNEDGREIFLSIISSQVEGTVLDELLGIAEGLEPLEG